MKRSIGFKLTLIISVVLSVIFISKACYDAIRSYSDAIKQKTQLLKEENQLCNSRAGNGLFKFVSDGNRYDGNYRL